MEERIRKTYRNIDALEHWRDCRVPDNLPEEFSFKISQILHNVECAIAESVSDPDSLYRNATRMQIMYAGMAGAYYYRLINLDCDKKQQ